jgi:hypothetical protein
LTLCLLGALASIAHYSTGLARSLGIASAELDGSWTSFAVSWLGTVALTVGAALLVVTARGTRRAVAPAWGACVAFGAALLAEATAVGMREPHSAGHQGQGIRIALLVVGWTWQVGITLLPLAAAEIASPKPLARRLAIAAPCVALASAIAQEVTFHGEIRSVTSDWVLFAAQTAGPALAVVAIVLALATPRDPAVPLARNVLGDAAVALPVAIGVRAALAALYRVEGLGVQESSRAVTAAMVDGVLGILTLACVVVVARAPWTTARRWGCVALLLAALGHVPAVFAAGHLLDILRVLGCASLGVVGPGSASSAVEVAHLAGIAATVAAALAVAALCRSLAVPDAARRARVSACMLFVAGTASLRATQESATVEPLLTLVALGACALGSWQLLLAGGAVRGTALLQTDGFAVSPPPEPEPGEDEAPLEVPEGAPGDAATQNPYASPRTRVPRVRGRVGSRKLVGWRPRARHAVDWVVVPPLAIAVLSAAVVIVAGLGADTTGTLSGFVVASGAAAVVLAFPLAIARVAARSFFVAGVFAATTVPRLRVALFSPSLRGATRVAASISLAANAGFAIVAISFGARAAGESGPWLVVADDLAYATAALCGARVLAAGHRDGPARVLRALAFAFAALAAICIVVAQGDPASALQIDAWACAGLAFVAVPGAWSLREVLEDGPPHHARTSVAPDIDRETTGTIDHDESGAASSAPER